MWLTGLAAAEPLFEDELRTKRVLFKTTAKFADAKASLQDACGIPQRDVEEMALLTVDDTKYGKLLARSLPHVIKTEEENERMLSELERLDTMGRPLTPEEKCLAELMTLLVLQFEEWKYPLDSVAPLEALNVLMEDRQMRQRDLIPVFGSSSVASDVLNGKRASSKAHARKLSEFFRVPVGLFI